MQQFSFELRDPMFDVGGWRVGFQLITYENVYGLDPSRTTCEETEDGWHIRANRLTWAGGQETTSGGAELHIRNHDDARRITVSINAHCNTTIRCTKLILTELPPSGLVARMWQEEAIPEEGIVYQYPGYLDSTTSTVQTPLVFLKPQLVEEWIGLRSTDDTVRCKRFAAYRSGESITVELIHEEAADSQRRTVTVPAWRIERTTDPGSVVRQHAETFALSFGLQPWEQRQDVPAWARDVALVAAVHGMHWSGYVFNTYDEMLQSLHWIADRIEGRRVLAYLPGWEGRYYWQYGEYRPDPRLGGDKAFARLVDGAHALGVHVMPMFGMNSVNTSTENFDQWGEPARMRTAGGFIYQGNKPDWDTARARDPAWQAILNPGAPTWRNHLLEQVENVVDTYDLRGDAVFFDTSHWWTNDPNHRVYDGIRALKDSLVARYPDLLVTGEGWYDALGAVTPVSHSHAPSRWVEEAFAPYNRTFGHLSTGDPSRGSTGVHELGTRPFRVEPLERHRWPSITIVDGTIERAPEQVQAIINQARAYVDEYL